MLNRLRQLFGLDPAAAPAIGPTTLGNRATRPGSDDGKRVHADLATRYFELSTEIEQGKADGDFARAIRAARATYAILPKFVREWTREYGSFDINTSHAVHTAPSLMAVMGDVEGIRELRSVLESVTELLPWLPAAEEAESDLAIVPGIIALVHTEPGVIQSSLKTRLDQMHGARVSQLASWLEKGGRIYRVKKGSSYQLYPAGYAIPQAGKALQPTSSPASTPAPPETVMPIARTGVLRANRRRSASKARLLDFAGLPIVRLPRAPLSWEERDARAESVDTKGAKKTELRFVVEGEGWSLAREEKLAPSDRPDPAYKDVFHTGGFTHWLDPKGKREGYEYAASVLRVTDRDGRVVAERGLAHDVYRSDVNVDGSGILFLSREGLLHGYTETLAPFIEESLLDLPEYQAQAARLNIGPRELKNHTRCVAIATDRRHYLVTVVDEAWCLDTATGEVVWGFRMPSKEGWVRRVADRSDRVGTSDDVEAALRFMSLELPVSPEDITRQYRTLAMKWHPDRNPGDPSATRRFQELGNAMELLTGANLSRISNRDVERVTYEQVLSSQRVETTIRDGRGGEHTVAFEISLVVGESFASDWIYAANFGSDGRAFLAGYSGRIVAVSPRGIPERVYDIGAVPRHIADAGEYLYILTDTRLYVLSGDQLVALVDVYGAADVIVTDRGFAILESKAFTWFTPTGRRVGSVRTKDPLRRVLSTSDGLVVETRQHRGFVDGAPSWWK